MREDEHSRNELHDSDKLITTAPAATILETVPDNVRRLARIGQLATAAVVGRNQRLFRLGDVLRLAEQRRIKGSRL